MVHTLRHTRQYGLPMMASHIAFRLTVAIFPGLIAFIWLTGVLHMEGVVSLLLDLVATVTPSAAQDSIRQQFLNPPVDQSAADFSLSAIISVIITIVALASAFTPPVTRSTAYARWRIHDGQPSATQCRSSLRSSLACSCSLPPSSPIAGPSYRARLAPRPPQEAPMS